MSNHQVTARKYRPQSFSEVLGQDNIVTTLKNAIQQQRLAHAYLFCGSRGTGKTTLARVFAKSLNCQSPSTDYEPCNKCSSCKEIAQSRSLDVLEIDGASHRGIDDVRRISDTVGYTPAYGKYKVYIIDEVHMLTKEAFNALLKTLEEPPPQVIFLFATTEPHKVLPTILSRCQRFNLNRIPLEKIVEKLWRVSKELGIEAEKEALYLLAQRADGGLRDAESLFDQIVAFHNGSITAETVADVLGIMSKDAFFNLDKAGKEGRLSVAFEIAHQVFSQGKDLMHFIDALTEHFRLLLLIKLSGLESPFLTISESDRAQYEASAKLYSQEQCLHILDLLIEAQSQVRFQSSGKIALEAILLRVMRTHQRLPIDFLIRRLSELEQAVLASPIQIEQAVSLPPIQAISSSPQAALPAPIISPTIPPPTMPPTSAPTITQKQQKDPLPLQIKESPTAPPPHSLGSLSIDPTPSPKDLGKKIIPKEESHQQTAEVSNLLTQNSIKQSPKQSHYDTILQFAAIELEGTIQK